MPGHGRLERWRGSIWRRRQRIWRLCRALSHRNLTGGRAAGTSRARQSSAKVPITHFASQKASRGPCAGVWHMPWQQRTSYRPTASQGRHSRRASGACPGSFLPCMKGHRGCTPDVCIRPQHPPTHTVVQATAADFVNTVMHPRVLPFTRAPRAAPYDRPQAQKLHLLALVTWVDNQE